MSDYIVEMKHITKRFPGIVANDDVTIQIKKGEIIGLDNSKLAYVDKDINKVVLRLVKKLINSDTSYVTLIYGADVTDENAEKMQKLLSQKLNDRIEVMLINGGQPVYYYIISVE